MYSIQIVSMRLLLIVVSLVWIFPLFGQNQDTNDASEEKEGLSKDSRKAVVVKKTDKKIKSRASEKKAVEQEYGTFDMEEAESEAPMPGIQSTQSYKAVESNFNLNKVQSTNQRTQRSPSVSQQNEMNNAVKFFETNSPNSFEHNFFYYVSGNYDISREYYLNQAESMRPSNADVQIQKAALFIIKGDKQNAIKYIDKLIVVNRLSASALSYGKDVLKSTPIGGTLVTHGFDDTYSVWYAQNKLGIRKDVVLVSLDFMQSDYYQSELTKKGYNLPTSNLIDVNYFTSFCQLNVSQKVSVSMTLPKEYLSGLLPNLYVTGLVFEYHEDKYSNFNRNNELWNSILSKDLVNHASDEKGKQLSSNYLPMLLQLRRVYNEKGNVKQVKLVDQDIDKVGVQCRKYDKVQQLKGAY